MGLMLKEEDLKGNSLFGRFMINLLALVLYGISILLAVLMFKWLADPKISVGKKVLVFIVIFIFCGFVSAWKDGLIGKDDKPKYYFQPETEEEW